MIFYLIAILFAFFGALFWIIDNIGGAIQTKSWSVLRLIGSAVTIAIKFCYDNPGAIKEFFNNNIFR